MISFLGGCRGGSRQQGEAGSCWVLLGATGWYWVVLGAAGCCWGLLLPGEPGLAGEPPAALAAERSVAVAKCSPRN